MKTLTGREESEEEAEHNHPAQANVLNVAAEVEETRAFASEHIVDSFFQVIAFSKKVIKRIILRKVCKVNLQDSPVMKSTKPFTSLVHISLIDSKKPLGRVSGI